MSHDGTAEKKVPCSTPPENRMAKKFGTTVIIASWCLAACGGGAGTSPAPVSASSLSLEGGAAHPLLRGTRHFTPDQISFWAGVDCYENHSALRVCQLPS